MKDWPGDPSDGGGYGSYDNEPGKARTYRGFSRGGFDSGDDKKDYEVRKDKLGSLVAFLCVGSLTVAGLTWLCLHRLEHDFPKEIKYVVQTNSVVDADLKAVRYTDKIAQSMYSNQLGEYGKFMGNSNWSPDYVIDTNNFKKEWK